MPELLGKSVTEAKIELGELGLDIVVIGSEKSSEYPAGQIIEQSIAQGERIQVGEAVDVVIAGAGSGSGSNTGTSSSENSQTQQTTTEEKVTVPAVTNKTEAEARSALEAVGLKVGTVSEANSDTIETGKVISQSISGSVSVEKGTTVNLVISKGPNKTKVTDVIGHEVNRATGELQGDGFIVDVKEVFSDDMRSGLVISTSPERGTYVDPGSTVTITVSKGREQVTIPSVSVGMSFEKASEALRDAGFDGTIKEGRETSESVGEGFVTRYDPYKTVDPDGTVTIYVSTGSASAAAPEQPSAGE